MSLQSLVAPPHSCVLVTCCPNSDVHVRFKATAELRCPPKPPFVESVVLRLSGASLGCPDLTVFLLSRRLSVAFTSTETMRTIRDGEPRTATSTALTESSFTA